MMWLGATLGLRWAEVAGLRVEHIDVLGGKVAIDRQLARSGQLEPPKSAAGIRTLACPTWLLDDLAGLLSRRSLTAVDGDVLVFVSKSGASMNYTNWRQRVWVPRATAQSSKVSVSTTCARSRQALWSLPASTSRRRRRVSGIPALT